MKHLIFFFSLLLPSVAFATSLADWVQIALKRHPSIQTATSTVETARGEMLRFLGKYDPAFSSDISYSDQRQPVALSFLADQTESFSAGAQFSKRFLSQTQITLNQTTGRTKDNSNFSSINPQYTHQTGITLEQALLKNFIGQTERENFRILQRTLEIAQQDLKQAQEQLALQVTQAYLALWHAQTVLTISEQSQSDATEFLSITWRLKRQGLKDTSDVLRAEAAVLQRKSEVLSAEATLEKAWNQFSALVRGYADPDFVIEKSHLEFPNWETEPLEDRPLETATKQNPTLIKAALEMHQAESQVNQTKGDFLPDLTLSGGYHWSGLKDNLNDAFSETWDGLYPTWTVGLKLHYPFGNRLSVGKRIQAQATRDRSRAQQQNLLNQLSYDLRTLYKQLDWISQQYTVHTKLETVQNKILKQVSKKYRQGRESSRDVLDSQNALRAARLQTAQIRKNWATLRTQYWEKQGILSLKIHDVNF